MDCTLWPGPCCNQDQYLGCSLTSEIVMQQDPEPARDSSQLALLLCTLPSCRSARHDSHALIHLSSQRGQHLYQHSLASNNSCQSLRASREYCSTRLGFMNEEELAAWSHICISLTQGSSPRPAPAHCKHIGKLLVACCNADICSRCVQACTWHFLLRMGGCITDLTDCGII